MKYENTISKPLKKNSSVLLLQLNKPPYSPKLNATVGFEIQRYQDFANFVRRLKEGRIQVNLHHKTRFGYRWDVLCALNQGSALNARTPNPGTPAHRFIG